MVGRSRILCKDPEVGLCLVYSRNIEEARVSNREEVGGQCKEGGGEIIWESQQFWSKGG